MSFNYQYTVEFRDTDAAGVVYFASILSICHVAYEASLIQSGIDLKLFVRNPEFAVPIYQVSANFLQPLFCGDRVQINLAPCQLDNYKFQVKYEILSTIDLRISATAVTNHIVINPQTRTRQELPVSIINWLKQFN